MRKKIVAGNWKMNNSFQEGNQLAKEVITEAGSNSEKVEMILIPPFIHLSAVNGLIESTSLKLGAQNCHAKENGAYTGEISAHMVKSCGADYCLVGHSERRAYNAETDEELLEKIKRLIEVGIQPIYCCGEQLEDRQAGNHFEVIEQQLKILWELSSEAFEKLVIAYEPVWAIGTGETASAEQAQEIHALIRKLIVENKGDSIAEDTSILYGGSCKPSNAQELFAKPDVDGGLIGGASLNAKDFVAIVNSFQ